MKVTEKTKLQPGIWAHICPACQQILASAPEPDWLPKFSICNCDLKESPNQVYQLYTVGLKTMIRRNTYPRFTAEVNMRNFPALENIKLTDQEANAEDMDKAIHKAGEFLVKNPQRRGR